MREAWERERRTRVNVRFVGFLVLVGLESYFLVGLVLRGLLS